MQFNDNISLVSSVVPLTACTPLWWPRKNCNIFSVLLKVTCCCCCCCCRTRAHKSQLRWHIDFMRSLCILLCYLWHVWLLCVEVAALRLAQIVVFQFCIFVWIFFIFCSNWSAWTHWLAVEIVILSFAYVSVGCVHRQLTKIVASNDIISHRQSSHQTE